MNEGPETVRTCGNCKHHSLDKNIGSFARKCDKANKIIEYQYSVGKIPYVPHWCPFLKSK